MRKEDLPRVRPNTTSTWAITFWYTREDGQGGMDAILFNTPEPTWALSPAHVVQGLQTAKNIAKQAGKEYSNICLVSINPCLDVSIDTQNGPEKKPAKKPAKKSAKGNKRKPAG